MLPIGSQAAGLKSSPAQLTEICLLRFFFCVRSANLASTSQPTDKDELAQERGHSSSESFLTSASAIGPFKADTIC